MEKRAPLSNRTKRRKRKGELESFSSDSNSFYDQLCSTSITNEPNNSLNISEPLKNCMFTINKEINLETIIETKSADVFSFINNHSTNIISSENDSDNSYVSSIDIISELPHWALSHKIAHSSFNDLLSILQKHTCFSSILKDARTILHTKPPRWENYIYIILYEYF